MSRKKPSKPMKNGAPANQSVKKTEAEKDSRHIILKDVLVPILSVIITGLFGVWVAHIKKPISESTTLVTSIVETASAITELSPTPFDTRISDKTPAPSAPSSADDSEALETSIQLENMVANPVEILDPVTFVLSPVEAIDDATLDKALLVLQSRLESMNKPYHIKADNQRIVITATRSSFGSNEIEVESTKRILAYTGGIYIGSERLGAQHLDSDDILHAVCLPFIEADSTEEQFILRIELSSRGAGKFQQIARDIERNQNGTMRIEELSFPEVHVDAKFIDSSVYISCKGLQETVLQLLSSVIGDPPLPVDFLMDVETSFWPGYQQKTISGDRVSFTLVQQPDIDKNYVLLDGLEFENAVHAIRKRMDTLERPFVLHVQNNEITVTTTPDRMSYEIIRLISRKMSLELYPSVGPAILNQDDVSFSGAFSNIYINLNQEGKQKLLLPVATSEDPLFTLYLEINGVRISRLDTSTRALRENLQQYFPDSLEFDTLLIHPQTQITEENQFLLSLLSTILHDTAPMPCDFLINDLHFESDTGDAPSIEFGINRLTLSDRVRITQAIHAVAPDAILTQGQTNNALYIGLPLKVDELLPLQFVKLVHQILEVADIADYFYTDIEFHLAGSDDSSVQIIFIKTIEYNDIVRIGPFLDGDVQQYAEDFYHWMALYEL